MKPILSILGFGKGREQTLSPEEEDLTEEQKHTLFQRAILSRWRRAVTPSLEEMEALKHFLPRNMTRDHFAVIDSGQLAELAGVLETSGSVSAYLRKHGLSLPFPRNDVAMSLIWLACGEGDALARLWMIDALARTLVEERADDPLGVLGLLREHLSLLGLGNMGFDDVSVRHFVRTVVVGSVTQPARKGAPEHGRVVETLIDGLLAMRLYPGWRSDFDGVLTALSVTDPRTPSDEDFTAIERMPEPRRARALPEESPAEHSMRVVSGDFAAEKHMKRFAAFERSLPLLLGTGLDTLREDMVEEFPWMADVTDKIVNALALRMRGSMPWFTLPPILLLGPPGTGKTRFVRRLAQRAGIPLTRIQAAGRGGAVELLGHSPTYREAHPSAPVTALAKHNCANPILLVDEVDKFGSSDYNGDPRDGLVAMLERETAKAFQDDNLRTEVDISQISFILTANSADNLTAPLLDRLTVYRIEPPDGKAFDGILEGLLDDIADEVGLARNELPTLPDEAVPALRKALLEGKSIRKLKAAVKAAIERGAGKTLN